MIIYQSKTKYNPDDGKPYQAKIFKEIRDDFTGEILDNENIYCRYNLDYKSQDPCFGSTDDEFEFGEKYNIDVYEFLAQEYHFYHGADNSIKNDFLMMQSFIKNEEHISFADMCRESRIKSATRLIDDGIIKASNLSSIDDDL